MRDIHWLSMLGNVQVKPCMSPNLAWSSTAEVPYGKFLRMSNHQGSSNPRICLFFPTMHHKAKLSQWIRNEKFVSFLTHQCWRVPLSKLMRPLGQFCVCIVRLVLFLCFCRYPPLKQRTANRLPANWRLSIQDVFRHSVTLHFSDKLKQSGRCMLLESSSVWDVRFPSSKALGAYSTQF